jgi:hypothetical protein
MSISTVVPFISLQLPSWQEPSSLVPRLPSLQELQQPSLPELPWRRLWLELLQRRLASWLEPSWHFILLEHHCGAGVSGAHFRKQRIRHRIGLDALFLRFPTFGKQIFPVTPIEKTDR